MRYRGEQFEALSLTHVAIWPCFTSQKASSAHLTNLPPPSLDPCALTFHASSCSRLRTRSRVGARKSTMQGLPTATMNEHGRKPNMTFKAKVSGGTDMLQPPAWLTEVGRPLGCLSARRRQDDRPRLVLCTTNLPPNTKTRAKPLVEACKFWLDWYCTGYEWCLIYFILLTSSAIQHLLRMSLAIDLELVEEMSKISREKIDTPVPQ